ncbi:hypothetical protein ART_0333 [Arthrobacter sp. PAMC 25486]|nr:hypothetical protein ART_0333 [Arthrobacter sp. PAMC 25486]
MILAAVASFTDPRRRPSPRARLPAAVVIADVAEPAGPALTAALDG